MLNKNSLVVIDKKNKRINLFKRNTSGWSFIKKNIQSLATFKIKKPSNSIFLKRVFYYTACTFTFGPFISLYNDLYNRKIPIRCTMNNLFITSAGL